MSKFDHQVFAVTIGRGLSRDVAAGYVGIGTTFFDQQVAMGKLPKPFKLGARRLWDRNDLDVAIDNLKDAGKPVEHNPWDDK